MDGMDGWDPSTPDWDYYKSTASGANNIFAWTLLALVNTLFLAWRKNSNKLSHFPFAMTLFWKSLPYNKYIKILKIRKYFNKLILYRLPAICCDTLLEGPPIQKELIQGVRFPQCWIFFSLHALIQSSFHYKTWMEYMCRDILHLLYIDYCP